MAEDKTGIVNALMDYLLSRNAMPQVKTDEDLREGTRGKFSYGGDSPAEGSISLEPGADVSTLGHELTHAADRQMTHQYYDSLEKAGKTPELKMFQDAFSKLRFRDARTASLQKFGEPEWWKKKQDYRASTRELPAYGVSFAIKPPGSKREVPVHLDPTAATEFLILLDLAQRQIKSKSK